MNGVVNVLKPPAMTSSDVVCDIRRIFGEKRVGHTGTLDPGAAGVLPVCVGRATKLADYIMRGDKEYIAEAVFGVGTDTLDSYGHAINSVPADITRNRLERALPKFLGEIWQQAPAYSAVKHQGKPLYKLARQGVTVEKPPRQVTVSELEILDGTRERFLLRIKCSKGTYIRTLLADMAAELGTCAYTSFLLRTETCGFRLKEAYTLDEVKTLREKAVVPMEQASAFLPRIDLKEYLYDIVCSGAVVDLQRAKLQIENGVDYAVYCKNELIGIGKQRDDTLKITAMIKI